MAKDLPDYRLKVERAKAHIGELARESERFISKNPYSVVCETDGKTGDRVYRLKINEPIPAILSAVVGDAVHNLRTSLDYLMCAVVRRGRPEGRSVKHVHFVVRETKEEFEADLPKNIKGASDAAIQLVHDLKPYKGGDDALHRLHRLDLLDKHQAIVPVWTAYKAFNIGAAMCAGAHAAWENGPDMPKLAAPFPVLGLWLRPADRRPLNDGAELLRIKPAAQTPHEDKFQFMVEIAFGQDGVLEGEPLVPTLTQLAEQVSGIFEIFERSILK